ncbi:transcription initiation factor TFIIIB [Paenibacillus faecalis]|uniref:transcription initiation factor TFIIIB n=1 Tax=Paenibacillus faecalis TaxID=2079532 RepID=UPI000D10C9AA|nr:transcription initiation factor TFIIIB [Paenibacillus faecalis]
MDHNKTICPKCGSRETSKGVQYNQGNVYPVKKTVFMGFGSEVLHIFCSKCGFIKESFVKNPEKFKDKDD